MSALDKDKDPFEDLFRDNLFDFESEPNDKLWKAIEPQLPANPARKIPYWQFAAVAVLLLLTGIGVYLWPSAINSNVETKTEKSGDKLATSPTVSENDTENNGNNKGEMNKSGKIEKDLPITDETNTVSSNSKDKNTNSSNELTNESTAILSSKNTSRLTNKKIAVIEKEVETNKKQIVLKDKSSNRTYSGIIPPAKPTDDNEAELANAGKQETTSFSNDNKYSFGKSNKSKRSGVFLNNIGNTINDNTANNSNLGNGVIENRFTKLSALDSKDYHPFTNHFRTPRIRYRGPKPSVYFKETKPLEWYVSAMPLINYYTITANGNDANYVHKIAVNDDADRLGFYTQAGLVFTLSDRFKLRTGLTFTKTNHSFSYQVRTDSLVVQSPDNTGVDVGFAELKKEYAQSAYYLGTKLELQYTFLRGESLSHYVNIGVEGAYKINGGGQVNGFANIAYGITRQIGDNAYLFIEPTYSYSLNQQSDSNSLLLIKPNKIGFNIGINFKLR